MRGGKWVQQYIPCVMVTRSLENIFIYICWEIYKHGFMYCILQYVLQHTCDNSQLSVSSNMTWIMWISHVKGRYIYKYASRSHWWFKYIFYIGKRARGVRHALCLWFGSIYLQHTLATYVCTCINSIICCAQKHASLNVLLFGIYRSYWWV